MKNTRLNLDTKTRAFLSCGAIACPVFILAFLIEGATRTAYNSFRHPISSLSIGVMGWTQITNFIITGLLLLAFAIGLRRALQSTIRSLWGPLLIGLVAIGLIGAGIFSTDPVYGYPPNKPLLLAEYSIHGQLHVSFSVLVFMGLPAACFVFRQRFVATGEHGWASYSLVTGITMFTTLVFAGMGFKQFPGLVDFAGVLQRLTIAVGWAWMELLALHLLKTAGRVS